jgi:hypothetical protein
MTTTDTKLDVARQALREIAARLEAHPGAHACAGADCATCNPASLETIARDALALSTP